MRIFKLVTHFIRIGLAILGFYLLLEAFDNSHLAKKSMENLFPTLTQPYSYLILFTNLLFISILSWHLILWKLIWPADPKGKIRRGTLRSLDYIWYGSAIIGALVAVNELQKISMTSRIEKMFNDNEYASDGAKRYAATIPASCSAIFSARDEEITRDLDGYRDFVNARFLCEEYTVRKKLDDSGFATDCKDRGFRTFPDNDEDFPVGKPHVKKIANALSNIGLYCMYRNEMQEVTFEEMQRQISLRDRNVLPSKENSQWYIILIVIIGLRLVKTTSEVADAARGV